MRIVAAVAVLKIKKLWHRVKRRVYFSLLMLILFSCSSKNASDWIYNRHTTHCSRLFYPASDSFNGISLEIVRIDQEIWIYLGIYTFQTASDVTVVSFGGESCAFEVCRLRGDQKALLSQEGTAVLIEALLEGCSVWIEWGVYKQKVEAEEFKTLYQKLLS